MMGLKLIHVSKGGYWCVCVNITPWSLLTHLCQWNGSLPGRKLLIHSKLQRLHHWSLGMDNLTLCWACDDLSMLGLKSYPCHYKEPLLGSGTTEPNYSEISIEWKSILKIMPAKNVSKPWRRIFESMVQKVINDHFGVIAILFSNGSKTL